VAILAAPVGANETFSPFSKVQTKVKRLDAVLSLDKKQLWSHLGVDRVRLAPDAPTHLVLSLLQNRRRAGEINIGGGLNGESEFT
jgi:hypothetical protein